MAKNFGGIPNNLNMGNLMKQAQKMQKQMADTQEELESRSLEVTAGGGAIKITITGKKELSEIVISPEVVDPDDVEMLQDLILSAVNEAIRQASEMVDGEMSKITGGMGMPGGLF